MTDFEYFLHHSKNGQGIITPWRVLRGVAAASLTATLTLYGVTGACLEAICRRMVPQDMDNTVSYRIVKEIIARISNWYERS